MAEISDSLRLLFETPVETNEDRYMVSIPSEFVESGQLELEETYRVALFSRPPKSQTSASKSNGCSVGATNSNTKANGKTDIGTTDSSHPSSQFKRPPVKEGEIRSVTIESLGDQGDGIARVGPGFVVIVPETKPRDELDVEIVNVAETVAFAEPVAKEPAE